MCLIKKGNYRTAKSNLHVFKALCCTSVSDIKITPYQAMLVVFNKGISVQEAKLTEYVREDKTTCVMEGLHAYVDMWPSKTLILGANVYHAIIPKGTKYAVGFNGDVVAEKMIYFLDEETFRNSEYTKAPTVNYKYSVLKNVRKLA